MWSITKAKIIDEATADEDHIEFTRWQLYEFLVSACELCDFVEEPEVKARRAA